MKGRVKETKRETERERHLPFDDSLSKWMQHLGLGKEKPGDWDSILGSHVCSRSLITCIIFGRFPKVQEQGASTVLKHSS